MLFAEAKVWSKEYKFETIKLCSEAEEENCDASPMVLYYERPMAQEIMRSAVEKKMVSAFSLKGEEFERTKYFLLRYRYDEREPVYNQFRQTIPQKIIHLPSNEIVTVYREKCFCESCQIKYGYNSILLYTAIAHPRQAPNSEIKMNLYQCAHCGKLFVEERERERLKEQYGALDINFYYPPCMMEKEEDEKEKYDLKKDSILSRHGYSTKLSTAKRHEILRDLIESDPNNVSQIVGYLNFFIRFQGPTHPDAETIWEYDLKYVNDYTCEHNEYRAYFDR